MIAPDKCPLTSRSGFLTAVLASGLIPRPELARLATDLPADARSAADVAHHWVSAGVLTPFQADRLLDNRTDGFVLGPYVILDKIGRSPVGRTYKARHRAMKRLVAIEVLAPELTRDPARRAVFQAESRSAAKLAHPNVVTVLDCNQTGDRLYRVLEYVDGTDLGRLVRSAGPLPVGRACEFARQAALGLQHAHERGICHGCLTPATVLVGRPGGNGRSDRPAVKVADFGLGRVAAPAADDPTAADYRAPDAPSPAADAYSLGGTLFYLLTGRPPARGQVAEGLRKDVPPPVAALVRQLLAPTPADRPTAAAVAGLLEPFGEGPDAGQVDFNLPPHGSGTVGASYLTGMPRPTPEPALTDTSPWAELDGPTLETVAAHTPVTVRRPRPGKVPTPVLAAAVGSIALLTIGLIVGIVLRAVAG